MVSTLVVTIVFTMLTVPPGRHSLSAFLTLIVVSVPLRLTHASPHTTLIDRLDRPLAAETNLDAAVLYRRQQYVSLSLSLIFHLFLTIEPTFPPRMQYTPLHSSRISTPVRAFELVGARCPTCRTSTSPAFPQSLFSPIRRRSDNRLVLE